MHRGGSCLDDAPKQDRAAKRDRHAADSENVARARHTHLALYLGVPEAKIRDAIAKNRNMLERIENLHGNSVYGQYLTIDQACALADILGRPPKEGAEPFDAYFALKKKVDRIVDAVDAKRDALEKLQATTVFEDGKASLPLPSLRSRIMTRLKRPTA